MLAFAPLFMAAATTAPTITLPPRPVPVDFDNIACNNTDLARALKGRRMTNGTAVSTEKKYAAISLKNLGADMVNDDVSMIVWRLCDRFVVLLVDTVVRDAIGFAREPVAIDCRQNGKERTDITGLMPVGAKGAAHPESAYEITEKPFRFVPVTPATLLCKAHG